jgi:hypothetical protein
MGGGGGGGVKIQGKIYKRCGKIQVLLQGGDRKDKYGPKDKLLRIVTITRTICNKDVKVTSSPRTDPTYHKTRHKCLASFVVLHLVFP